MGIQRLTGKRSSLLKVAWCNKLHVNDKNNQPNWLFNSRESFFTEERFQDITVFLE